MREAFPDGLPRGPVIRSTEVSTVGPNTTAKFTKIAKAAAVKGNSVSGVTTLHDLRRAFATLNADRMTPDALQALMQHKSYQTTQRYINMARQIDKAVEALYVPTVKRAEGS